MPATTGLLRWPDEAGRAAQPNIRSAGKSVALGTNSAAQLDLDLDESLEDSFPFESAALPMCVRPRFWVRERPSSGTWQRRLAELYVGVATREASWKHDACLSVEHRGQGRFTRMRTGM